MFRRLSLMLGLCSAMLLAGCASGPRQFAFDEPALRSILVVPVINETNSVEADTLMHATATTPLANMGYYAFPVDTVKFVLESESLYEPERVRELGPVKLAEMFHADSVLFIKVTYWDAQYIVLNTKTKVTAEYELFKADGTSLWKDTVTFVKDSSSQNASLIGLMVDAAVAAINRAAPDFRPLAKSANVYALRHWHVGPHVLEAAEKAQQKQ